MDDAEDLDRRRKAAADRFLKAVHRYQNEGKRNGKYIIDRYLRRFDSSDSERSEVAIEIAQKTIGKIERFGAVVTDLSFKVSIIMISSKRDALSATTESIECLIDDFLKALDNFNYHMIDRNSIKIHQNSGITSEEKLGIIRTNLKKKFELTIFTADTASNIIESTCDTLQDFLDNRLYASRKIFAERLKHTLNKVPREGAFATFKFITKEILEEMLGSIFFIRWLMKIKAFFQKIITPAGTSAGDTDIMLKLLPELDKSTNLLEELEKAFQITLEQNMKADSTPRSI